MIEIAKEVILVADSSKFLNRSLAFICPLDQIDIVVTDKHINKGDLKKLQNAGIKVLLA